MRVSHRPFVNSLNRKNIESFIVFGRRLCETQSVLLNITNLLIRSAFLPALVPAEKKLETKVADWECVHDMECLIPDGIWFVDRKSVQTPDVSTTR